VTNSPQAAAPADHATHVAGVIGANQGGQVTGMAPQSQIMGVSFMDTSGTGTLGNAILALQYAAQHGAKIINNSWGGPGCMATFQSAMQDLSNQGILLMVAAGNDGADLSQSPTYPAVFNLPNQITVAASQENNYMATFSNSSWTLVHLAAPGQDIYSTVTGASYAFMSGTSMATPFLTGAAAVLMGAVPNATPAQIKAALLAGVDSGPFRVVTQGRLNLQKALQQLQSAVQ
jgi:subtilisin family serine protease